MEGISYCGTVLCKFDNNDLHNRLVDEAKRQKLTLHFVDEVADFIAIPAFLAIVDPASLTETEWNDWMGFIEEIGDRQFKVLLTAPSPYRVRVPAFNLVKAPYDLSEEFLKFLLLRVRSQVAKQIALSQKRDRQIFRLLFILRQLDFGNLVRVRDLASELEVSSRTIERDLQLLLMAGYPLDNANQSGCYRFPPNFRAYDLHFGGHDA